MSYNRDMIVSKNEEIDLFILDGESLAENVARWFKANMFTHISNDIK